MSPNPYLESYPQSEVETLTASGSIQPNVDEHANLIVEKDVQSLYSSSITIPLINVPVNSTKVETKYQVQFTEL
jgi:hypothetical protein